MNQLQQEITSYLANNNYGDATEKISEYSKLYPNDYYTIFYQLLLAIHNGDIDTAFQLAQKGINEYPLNVDFQTYYGLLCEEKEDYISALYHLGQANIILNYSESGELSNDPNSSIIEDILRVQEKSSNYYNSISSQTEMDQFINRLGAYNFHLKSRLNLYSPFFRQKNALTGTYFYEDFSSRKYIGCYKDQYHIMDNESLDLVSVKGEFVSVEEGTIANIPCGSASDEYMIALASKTPNNLLSFNTPDGNEYTCLQRFAQQFSYYRVPSGTSIHSCDNMVYGQPIKIHHSPDRKRLVLNIFVDGLAELYLRGDQFAQYMPFTYERFKSGMVFDHAYSTGEWTYPCLATFATGVDTTHHMMFHSTLEGQMPENIKTLAECFHETGYFTSNIGGNWRIIPAYGHARGYDRFIYQHQLAGFKVQEIISEAINNIEQFKEMDHFTWITIGDLHDVADDVSLPTCVQSQINIKDRIYDETVQKATSAKQPYCETKIQQYLKELAHVDQWLQILYQYLDRTFEKDEIIISIFSDHGQGYMVKDHEHFLADGRSNVAFMFSGSVPEKGVVHDVESITDYVHIMRELAGVKQPDSFSDGILPSSLGGSVTREYAITDSIHPNDPYQASLHMNDGTFYFINPSPVTIDGRFALGDYTYYLTDNNNLRIHNSELEEKCLAIILNHIDKLVIH